MSDAEIKDVFEQAFKLPAEERARLVHALIDTLTVTAEKSAANIDLASLRGLFRSDQPPPSDDDVKRMIHEHKMSKYGS